MAATYVNSHPIKSRRFSMSPMIPPGCFLAVNRQNQCAPWRERNATATATATATQAGHTLLANHKRRGDPFYAAPAIMVSYS